MKFSAMAGPFACLEYVDIQAQPTVVALVK
jgi:hypothetical protein